MSATIPFFSGPGQTHDKFFARWWWLGSFGTVSTRSSSTANQSSSRRASKEFAFAGAST